MNKQISNILAKLMRDNGLSEGELSRQCGVTQPTIHRILTGESRDPRRSNVQKIARIFGLTVPQLLGEAPLDKVGEATPGYGASDAIPLLSAQQAIAWREGKLSEIELADARRLGDQTMRFSGVRLIPAVEGRQYLLYYTGPELMQFGIPQSPITLLVDPDKESLYPSSVWVINGQIRIGIYKVFDAETHILDYLDPAQGKRNLNLETDKFIGWQVGIIFPAREK